MSSPDPVGGPVNPDPPDPAHLLDILQNGEAAPAEDGTVAIRGYRYYLEVIRGAWTLTAREAVRIDPETVKKLQGPDVYIDGVQILVGGERYELVAREVTPGRLWACLEPAVGGPTNPDLRRA